MVAASRWMLRPPWWQLVAAAVTWLAAVVAPAAAATSGGPPGTVVTFAEPPGVPLSYIFPFAPVTESSVPNVEQFQALLWRPLAWFGTDETAARVDPSRSLYSAISYSDKDREVTVRLKPYRWSDGQPVTSRDIEFSYDLYRFNELEWAHYVPGQFPDNVASVRLPNPRTVVFVLKHRVNPTWFTDDQLSLITPMPQHAWDRTSMSTAVGNYDQDATGAEAVFNFLNDEAMDLATYATNPLWQVVDGPWRLVSFSADGRATFAPNPEYSGPVKPDIAAFEELPFPTAGAEVMALRSGVLDVGYLPLEDLGDARGLEAAGYRLVPWYNVAVGYALYDFGNPSAGPILSKLYVRQAIEQTENQSQIIRRVFGGFALPTDGPEPVRLEPDLVPAPDRRNPYPFDLAAARARLERHGWHVVSGSAARCRDPGTGPGHCGAGIRRGSRLAFDLLYPSGSSLLTAEVDSLRSSAARAGIAITPVALSFVDLVSTVGRCPSACNWQLAYFGVPSYEPVLPTGDNSFLASSALNLGGYRSASITTAINDLMQSGDSGALGRYERVTAEQLPWLWLPTPAYQLTVIAHRLNGAVPQNAYLYITPEDYRIAG